MRNLLAVSTKRRQKGGETVEFMLTLLFFLFVFFMIIEFAVLTYDRGSMNNAARFGSRQASLYWVDPICFSEFTPLINQRLKPDMVDTVMTWTNQNLLIVPGATSLSTALQVNGTNVSASPCSHPDGTTSTKASQAVLPTDITTVDIDYDHRYIGLAAFVPSTGVVMNTQSGAGVE